MSHPKHYKKHKSEQGEDVYDHEQHFALRLPAEQAAELHNELKNGTFNKDTMAICIGQDMRHGTVKFNKKKIPAKLVDLPVIVETLKTLDNKNFYKTADISQILICGPEMKKPEENPNEAQKSKKKLEREYQFKHGLTSPLKNVRKRRFRKTLRKKYMDAPELEKELKRLLRADLEAINVRYECVSAAEERQKQEPDPPPQPSTSQMAPVQESEVFGHVSDSSDEDAELMARQLMTSSNTDPTPAKTDDVLRLERLLADLAKEKQDLENQMKALDNPVLRQRMEGDISNIRTKEAEVTDELESAKQKKSNDGEPS